jgi:hypothetical protein
MVLAESRPHAAGAALIEVGLLAHAVMVTDQTASLTAHRSTD